MGEMVLGREKILDSIVEGLKPLDYVYAMWQCGSAAFGRVDEWSDIDVELMLKMTDLKMCLK
jgi:predicted nucleotidyltransferase